MRKRIIIIGGGLLSGIFFGIFVFVFFLPYHFSQLGFTQKQVIGFLPYWLLTSAEKNYSSYITTLAYFGLRVNADGSIQKLTTPQQEEPGWNALTSGKVNPFFDSAKKHGMSLSLVVATGDSNAISGLVSQPIPHGQKLVSSIAPLLYRYGFSDLNLDIEYTSQASSASQINFTTFLQTVRKSLNPSISLTVEITGDDVIKHDLINPTSVGKIANHVVIMAYDYHYPGSFVTGPVAPLGGAGIGAEYDVTTAVKKALQYIPDSKLILGIPDYGYEWEALSPNPRSAVIPGTGVVASSHRAENIRLSCSTCSAQFNKIDEEMHVSFVDQSTGTIHQFFYPTQNSTSAKINLANAGKLEGIGIWALGYEDSTILDPLKSYKNE